MSKKYDYLVVGAGLYGAVFAHEAKNPGKSVLVIDKRPNIAGNVFTEDVEGIHVHKYGAHIFHTNNKYCFRERIFSARKSTPSIPANIYATITFPHSIDNLPMYRLNPPRMRRIFFYTHP